MEENKNINSEETVNSEPQTEAEINETVKEVKDEIPKRSKKLSFKKKSNGTKKVRNQALLKKGSYSLGLTAIVIAGVIVFNILVGVLSERLDLNYDFTPEKSNSLSSDNIKYLKNLKNDVSIVFCGTEESYASYVAQSTARQNEIMNDAADYYEQTVRIVRKYASYNKKIDLQFMDTQSSEFTDIASKYANEQLSYGDIIVSGTKNGVERHKIVGFTDIYELSQDESMAQYGYTAYNVSGNNIETALTGAIAYTQSEKNKKIGILAGHSKSDRTAAYQKLLKENNFDVEVIDDKLITSVDSKLDALVIAAPSIDFSSDELDLITEFLENDGKLNKGLAVFLDASNPYLTNLYDFLETNGISAQDAKVFETNDGYHLEGNPTAMISAKASDDKICENVYYCLTDYNIPITAAFDERDGIKVTPLITTSDSTIAVPKETPADFTDFSQYDQKSYATVIQAEKSDYDDELKKMSSYITVFSSCDFLDSPYNETSSVSNKDLTFAVSERACGVENSDISFVPKTIANETYADTVTEASVNLVRIIFMIILPIAIIAVGIYIYIKRRNA